MLGYHSPDACGGGLRPDGSQVWVWMEAAESSVLAGRIDRKIEFPLPDEKTKKRIFQIHTSRMTLADDVTLDDLIMAKDDLSGADIKVNTWVGLPLGIDLLGKTANSRGGS